MKAIAKVGYGYLKRQLQWESVEKIKSVYIDLLAQIPVYMITISEPPLMIEKPFPRYTEQDKCTNWGCETCLINPLDAHILLNNGAADCKFQLYEDWASTGQVKTVPCGDWVLNVPKKDVEIFMKIRKKHFSNDPRDRNDTGVDQLIKIIFTSLSIYFR